MRTARRPGNEATRTYVRTCIHNSPARASAVKDLRVRISFSRVLVTTAISDAIRNATLVLFAAFREPQRNEY